MSMVHDDAVFFEDDEAFVVVRQIADPDVLRTYANRDEGIETLTSALGSLTARKISQQRQESSRRTVVWSAPDLHFLPIRIEQIREDRAALAFALEAIEWLDQAQARDSR